MPRLAVVLCVHHKPWLVMSTLITLFSQDYRDFDIYFIYQEGDGSDARYNSPFYKDYDELAKEFGINSHLDPYDPRTMEVCKISYARLQELYFKNDHGLDSGAWYKFIRTGIWEKYDYVFFIGEGTLLTFDSVISDMLSFVQKNDVHFITGSQEKQRMPKAFFLDGCIRGANPNRMDIFHERMVNEVFRIFCRDADFKNVFDSWSSDFKLTNEYHLPDIWGYKGMWLSMINYFYPNLKKGPKPKINLSSLSRLFFAYNQLVSRLSVYLADYLPRRNGINREEFIYVSNARVKLEEFISYQQEGKVKLHKENSPEWFGCCCNHFMSREFLRRLSDRVEKNNLFEAIELPFSASALEVIWGLIPVWLGFDKWFFNGIHRVRKNFGNFRREDDQEGMTRYLNRYYAGKFSVSYKGDFLKIKLLHKNLRYLEDILNSRYFN